MRWYARIARRLRARPGLARTGIFIVATAGVAGGMFAALLYARQPDPRRVLALLALAAGLAVRRTTDLVSMRVLNAPPAKGLMNDSTPRGIRLGLLGLATVFEIGWWCGGWYLTDGFAAGADLGSLRRISTWPAQRMGVVFAALFLLGAWRHAFELMLETERRLYTYLLPLRGTSRFLRRSIAKVYLIALMEILAGWALFFFVAAGHRVWGATILVVGLAGAHSMRVALRRPQQTERQWLQLLER